MSRTRCPLFLGLLGLTALGCDARQEPAMAERAAPAPSLTAGPSRPAAEASAKVSPAATAPADAPAPSAELTERGDEAPGAPASPLERDGLSRRAPMPAAGPLTAGRWSDRDDWPRWQGLLAPGSAYQTMLDGWTIDRVERVSVSLRGPRGIAADTPLELVDPQGRALWSARTDNQGRADLYLPPGGTATLRVRDRSRATLASREVRAGEEHQLRLVQERPVASALDVMFVVDTTGSMGDELSYLQAELRSIVSRIRDESPQALRVRTSVNFFRDRGDNYVVRSYPFTADIDQTLRELQRQRAGGGGDYPEALDAAIDDGINHHEWSPSAIARVMFVITDAPPHSGAQVGRRLQRVAAQAAHEGIRIVPIASSGVDKPTEFILRHLAVSTDGSYVFLTDHSGIGNAHIEPTVGPHVVEPLSDLLVDLIGDYTSTEELWLTSAPTPAVQSPARPSSPRPQPDGESWLVLAFSLCVPALATGLCWRSRRSAPRFGAAPVLPARRMLDRLAGALRKSEASDPRVLRARQMLGDLNRTGRRTRPADAESWTLQMREVVEGIERLVEQQRVIDASLRVAGTQSGAKCETRRTLHEQVARRRASINAEIEAGLLSVETAYLHVIGGVGERSATRANLDAARETLQTRIELERELDAGG